ncbi:MAG: AAA family ATPase [Thermofilaceae archaeon]
MDLEVVGRAGIWTVLFPDGIQVKFTQIHEDEDGIKSEVSFKATQSQKQYLLTTRINLSSSRSRAAVANMLNERFPLGKQNWLRIVEEACVAVQNSIRAPTPAVKLGEGEPRPLSFVLEPFIVEEEPNVIFGPSGAGKSYLALLFGVLVATGLDLTETLGLRAARTGNVVYVDWETSENELRRRLQKLCKGLGLSPTDVPLWYVRAMQPLTGNEHIAEIIMDLDPVLVILDSMGLAAGGPLNDPHTAVSFYKGLRQLDVNTLVIAHTPKNNDESIFGSGYFTYLARSIWELKASWEQDALFIGLFHRKFNMGRLESPHAFQLVFGPDSTVTVSRVNVTDVPDLSTRVSLRTRILNLLKDTGEAMSVSDIARTLGVEPNLVGAYLLRMAREGVVKNLRRGVYCVAEEKEKAEEVVPF